MRKSELKPLGDETGTGGRGPERKNEGGEGASKAGLISCIRGWLGGPVRSECTLLVGAGA